MLLEHLFGLHAGKSDVDLVNILDEILSLLLDFELVDLQFFFLRDLNLFIDSKFFTILKLQNVKLLSEFSFAFRDLLFGFSNHLILEKPLAICLLLNKDRVLLFHILNNLINIPHFLELFNVTIADVDGNDSAVQVGRAFILTLKRADLVLNFLP